MDAKKRKKTRITTRQECLTVDLIAGGQNSRVTRYRGGDFHIQIDSKALAVVIRMTPEQAVSLARTILIVEEVANRGIKPGAVQQVEIPWSR